MIRSPTELPLFTVPTLYTVLRAQHRHAPSITGYTGKRAPTHGYPGHTSLDAQRKALLKHFTPLQRASFRNSPNRSVIIVGAGLAGLCAAYELKKLGYNVSVYEARHRVGGRAYSFRFARNKIVEGGGELIGRNHPLWCGYAQNFKLKFSGVFDYGNSPVRFNGHTLTFEESKALADAMDPHIERLNHLADSIVDPYEPWTNANAAWLDNTSLADWLGSLKCPTEWSKKGRAALEQQLVADNGRSAGEQSLLGVLAMIKGHGVDRYWTDTEVYRCIGGNAQLAQRFRDELGEDVVHTGIKVTAVSKKKGIVSVELAHTSEQDDDEDFEADPNSRTPKTDKRKKLKPVKADEAILAIPPSVWHLIHFKDQDLRAKLKQAPRLGVNTKNLFAFKSLFWQNYSSSPTLTDSNGPRDMTWETSEDIHKVKVNKKPDFTFVAFSGASHSQELAGLASEQCRKAALLEQLRSVYPGIDTQITNSKFIDWPHKLFTQGSYYFPAPKEVSAWGPFWKTGYLDWLHFAGEHTSYAFMGYMEGALSSGFRLAHRLAVRDKLLP
jgi:monoamine oxidase